MGKRQAATSGGAASTAACLPRQNCPVACCQFLAAGVLMQRAVMAPSCRSLTLLRHYTHKPRNPTGTCAPGWSVPMSTMMARLGSASLLLALPELPAAS